MRNTKFKRIIALTVAFALLMGMAAFAAPSTPVPSVVTASAVNETRKVTVSGTTPQFADTIVTITVWYPDMTPSMVLSGTKTLAEANCFTTEVKVQADNTFGIVFDLKEDDPSGRYTVYANIPGLSSPLSDTFDYSNVIHFNDVASVVADTTKTATDIKAELDRKIVAVSPWAEISYHSYANESQREYVAKHLEATRPGASTLKAELEAAVEKVDITIDASEATRDGLLTILTDNYLKLSITSGEWSAFQTLVDDKREQVIVNLYSKRSTFILPENITSLFNSEVEAAQIVIPPPSDNRHTGGGGGGRGGGSFSVTGAIASTNTPSSQLEATDSFADIESVPWAKNAINILAAKGIINGKSETEFAPNDNITREEMIKLLVEGFKVKTASASTLPFKDAVYGTWYYDYVETAYNSKIVNGVSADWFGIGDNITRQDMAKMIYGTILYLGFSLEDKDEIAFADEGDIASYAEDAVVKLSASGVINGRGDGNFAPTATATRAEAAKMIYNVLYLFNMI